MAVCCDSDDSGNTGKRKRLSSSDSLDSSFSPPGGLKYKLRASGCIFGGKALSRHGSSSSSSTVGGPSTRTWGPAHINRLNFSTDNKIRTGPELFSTADIKTVLRGQLINVLLEPLESRDGTVLTAPKNENTDIKQLTEECSDKDPVLEYMEAVLEDMSEKHININNVTEKEMPALTDYYLDIVHQQRLNIVTTNTCNLSEATIHQFHRTFRHIFTVCALNKTSQLELDHLISNVMCLIQENEGWQEEFMIRKREETRVHFDICGTQVTSETNVVWEYPNYICNDCFLITAPDNFPIVLSENKSQVSERGKVSNRSVGFHTQRTTSFHKNIAQVIGQCVSIADKSPFETEDYKIVYHVSLMGTSELVVTRTHIAKSTLKVIKGGCQIPDQNDLDPSYVFEASFIINNDFTFAFFFVYTSLLILGKFSHDKLIFGSLPAVEG